MPLLTVLLACARPAPTAPAAPPSSVALVESVPSGLALDDPHIPDAAAPLAALIDGARARVEVAQFYLASAPDTVAEGLIEALARAAARGVAVRVLVDARLARTYPEPLARLAAVDGLALRVWDHAATRGAGVQHAKLILVDGRRASLGSHNLDWRAFTHILELGALLEGDVVAPYAAAFELDWAEAGGAPPPRGAPDPEAPALRFDGALPSGEPVALLPVFSPPEALPHPASWDWPQLLARIEASREVLRLQALSYAVEGYSGERFEALDQALRRAADRGVSVRLLVSDWSLGERALPDLRALAEHPGVALRVVSIPQPEGDFIPFARVAHAKLMVFDGEAAWVGSSNLSGDYFLSSRNVGLILEGPPAAAALAARFDLTWDSPWSAPFDPERHVAPPPRELE